MFPLTDKMFPLTDKMFPLTDKMFPLGSETASRSKVQRYLKRV